MRGRRRAREERKRKQATNFKEALCCPTAVVQEAAKRKNEGGVPGVTGTLGKAYSNFDITQTRSGTAPPH